MPMSNAVASHESAKEWQVVSKRALLPGVPPPNCARNGNSGRLWVWAIAARACSEIAASSHLYYMMLDACIRLGQLQQRRESLQLIFTKRGQHLKYTSGLRRRVKQVSDRYGVTNIVTIRSRRALPFEDLQYHTCTVSAPYNQILAASFPRQTSLRPLIDRHIPIPRRFPSLPTIPHHPELYGHNSASLARYRNLPPSAALSANSA